MENEPTTAKDTFGLPLSHPAGRRSAMGYLRSRLVTGALIAFPLVVTVFFGRFLFNLLDRWSYPLSKQLFGFAVPGAGVTLALVLFLLLGVLGHNVLGRRLLGFAEALVERVPVLRAVYMGAREVTRAFGGDRTKAFRRVVLIPFPAAPAWSIGFLTAEFDTASPNGPERMASVFMPTTPNPTTGFYLIFPMRALRETSLTVEEAVRLVISGGLLAPEPGRIVSAAPSEPDGP
jgi:uncharacterized membrane protein